MQNRAPINYFLAWPTTGYAPAGNWPPTVSTSQTRFRWLLVDQVEPNRKLQMRIALPAAKQQQQRQLIERVRSSLAGRRQNIHPFWPLCLEPENPQPIDSMCFPWPGSKCSGPKQS